MMVSGTAKSAKKCKMVMLRKDFFVVVICENNMLRNGNSGLKMGVSRAAHTQYAYVWKNPPPPGGGPSYFPDSTAQISLSVVIYSGCQWW